MILSGLPAARPTRRLLPAVTVVLTLIALVAAHLAAARGLYRSYPSSYSWTELLIDYQGGFTKRGLLGEAAFRLRGVVAPRHAVVDAVCAAYILAVAGLILPLRLPGSYAGLLFLASPLGALFPLVNPEAYGRKDAFLLLALVSGAVVAERVRGRTAAVLIPMAIFAGTGLITEIAWLYYPLVFAATLALRRAEPLRWRIAATAAAALYTGSCLALTLAAPRVDTAAIARSWPGGPYQTDATGALCCLNFRLADAVGVARATLPNLGGYALGLLAGLLPIAVLLASRPPRRADALTHAVSLAGVVLAMAPVFVAADWGRYIALWLTAVFLWLWTATRSSTPRPVPGFSVEGWIVRGALLCLYAGTWQLAYYQTPDRSALLPGILFRAAGWAPPEPAP